jgi:predicted RNase H-like HicB family nuclease
MATKQRTVLEFTVDIVVEPDGEEFHAYCPALKGLHVGGETEAEALQNATDAAILYIESMIRHNEAIPLSSQPAPKSSAGGRANRKARTHTRNLEVQVA